MDRRRSIGFALMLAAPVAAVAIWFAGLVLFAHMRWPPDWFGAVTGIALTTAAILLALGARSTARGAPRVLATDRRPPVLLLRSFTDDRTSLLATDTPERHLATALREIGPVIAVGRPREGLPPQGAARMYYDDAEWQQRVAHDIRRACVVVIRAGATPSLIWEIGEVLRAAAPERTLLALPERTNLDDVLWRLLGRRRASREERYAAFCRLTAGVLPHPLPEAIGKATFVAFDSDWRPRLLAPAGWRPYNLSFVVRIRETLRPWCAQLGIPLRRRRTIATAIGYSLLTGGMALATLIVLANMLGLV